MADGIVTPWLHRARVDGSVSSRGVGGPGIFGLRRCIAQRSRIGQRSRFGHAAIHDGGVHTRRAVTRRIARVHGSGLAGVGCLSCTARAPGGPGAHALTFGFVEVTVADVRVFEVATLRSLAWRLEG